MLIQRLAESTNQIHHLLDNLPQVLHPLGLYLRILLFMLRTKKSMIRIFLVSATNVLPDFDLYKLPDDRFCSPISYEIVNPIFPIWSKGLSIQVLWHVSSFSVIIVILISSAVMYYISLFYLSMICPNTNGYQRKMINW